MSIQFTKEQLRVQSTIRQFVKKELEPVAEKMDREQISASMVTKKLAKLNYIGVYYPTEYGGGGADFTTYCILLEEIAKACPATAACLAIQTASPYPLYKFGSPELKAKYLPSFMAYEKQTCFCLTEPEAGSDPSNLKTTAVLDGDYWVLNGTKRFISMGDEGDVIGVMARTGGEGSKGISAFMVDKSVSPFTVVSIEDKMGLRACHTTTLSFDNCRVPKENILGKPGDGLKIGFTTLDEGRVGVAAIALGTAEAALEEAIKAAKQRVQFGKRIADFQGIQWYIAEMAKNVEAARLLVYNAAHLCDEGKPFAVNASMAKLFTTETAVNNCVQSLQIHGGDGYMKPSKIERLYRDAKVLQIIEGTSEIQKMVISRTALA